jgi:hypothetical protein
MRGTESRSSSLATSWSLLVKIITVGLFVIRRQKLTRARLRKESRSNLQAAQVLFGNGEKVIESWSSRFYLRQRSTPINELRKKPILYLIFAAA